MPVRDAQSPSSLFDFWHLGSIVEVVPLGVPCARLLLLFLCATHSMPFVENTSKVSCAKTSLGFLCLCIVKNPTSLSGGELEMQFDIEDTRSGTWTSTSLVPPLGPEKVFSRLTILRGLGMADNLLGTWTSPELDPVLSLAVGLGLLTIRKGLGMSASSPQSDQNSMSVDSNDSDAIFS